VRRIMLITKVWTVFTCSITGVVCSNCTRGTDWCPNLFCLCSPTVSSGLAMGWSPVYGVLPSVNRIKSWKGGQGPTKGCRAIIIKILSSSRPLTDHDIKFWYGRHFVAIKVWFSDNEQSCIQQILGSSLGLCTDYLEVSCGFLSPYFDHHHHHHHHLILF
jgi:hypothetical protein